MKKFLTATLIALASSFSFAHAQAPVGAPNNPTAPKSVQMIQWDIEYVEHLVMFEYINPLNAELHLKIYGPQGYLVHVEDLSDADRSKLGFDLEGMADGEYEVVLESGEYVLAIEKVTLY
ncbi:hypothetical protein [Phaeocystidibacter luteus]|uniref:T9SS type A sorting domain-containing protein n=1 Tax=Phaeocystidibacter luteus TaxID=911197 RepID=A0A6N6RE80_9FLAO|nr:hypothetical protein [Phaeocystidibacter luteus]KAB2808053.1 hypothetical protein F8C67_10805 [Phaeocystidibacter luteus]